MAIRPPKYNSQGFTLAEMLAVVSIVGIVMGFAVPSLLSLNKPLRDGSWQFKSHLSLIRSKAISSNQAYRIRPRYATVAEVIAAHSDPITLKPDRAYPQAPNNFVVEYAANCKVSNSGWEIASQFDLDLPVDVGITDISPTFSAPSPVIGTVPTGLTWNGGAGICFDNRGVIDTTTRVVFKDFRGNNTAKIALFDISKVGNVDIYTYGSNTPTNPNFIPASPQGNPEF